MHFAGRCLAGTEWEMIPYAAVLANCAVFSAENAGNEIHLAFCKRPQYSGHNERQVLPAMKEVFKMLAVIGVCGAAYFAGMVYMTVAGMKD